MLTVIIQLSNIFSRDIIVEVNQGVHEQARGHAPKLGDQMLEVMRPLIPVEVSAAVGRSGDVVLLPQCHIPQLDHIEVLFLPQESNQGPDCAVSGK